jgi:hypothetical protein
VHEEKLLTAKFAKNGREGREEHRYSKARKHEDAFFAIFAMPSRSSRLKAFGSERVAGKDGDAASAASP